MLELVSPIDMVISLIKEKKGENIVVFDMKSVSDVSDFYILCSGDSDVQTRAIADFLEFKLKENGYFVSYKEGFGTGRWIILDYIDFVIHIFHKDARSYYNLESIWGDCIVWNEKI